MTMRSPATSICRARPSWSQSESPAFSTRNSAASATSQ